MAPSHASALGAHRRQRRRWPWVAAVVLALLLAVVGWVGVRGLLARGELEAALPLASRIQQQVADGDAAAAELTFSALQKHVDAAASLTSDPLWRAAEVVPIAGPNLTVVRELADVVSHITSRAIEPLTSLAGQIKLADFKPVAGTVNLQPLIDATPKVDAAASALADARKRVEAIDSSGTLGPVREAVAKLTSVLVRASDAVSSVDNAVKLLPAMLGVDGARNYLVLFQNPAELRSGGGIPGALALLHTEGGHVELVQQASSGSFPHYPEPVLELPAETRGIYGDITGEYIQDVTLTPQFPLAAALAREMWKRQFGVEVDGVLSADPVMLSYLLAATGPVDVGGEQLTSQNAVQVLLSDVYARYPNPSDQDAFFAEAASTVFSRVAGGDLDPQKLISALARAGAENRILVWSAHEADQAVLAGTTLAGGLPQSDDNEQAFGVYLNDATGSKMDYYLHVRASVGQVTCRNDGRQNLALDLTLSSSAPTDAASLPDYVTGGGSFGVKPGNVRTVVAIYGPSGAVNLGAASVGGPELSVQPTADSGYPVDRFTIELAPGESRTVRVGMLTAAAFDGRVVVKTTPGVNTAVTEKVSITCPTAPTVGGTQ